jgi:uncharacterized protein (TIGR03083 family)
VLTIVRAARGGPPEATAPPAHPCLPGTGLSAVPAPSERQTALSELDILTVTAADGHDLLTVAQSDWSRPVQDCPGWNAADLVGHMGAILGWIAKIVTSGQAVPRRDRETPPTDRDTLAAWYRAHLNRTLSILTATPPESRAWTFSSRGDQRVSWWRRRLAVELAIHRWDAQHAASLGAKALPAPLDGHVAAAGIEEFVTEFLPGLLSQPDTVGLTGSLHLHATDGTSEWWINLDERASAVAVPGHRKADTTIRATRSNLLLWLTNRQQPDTLEISGPPEVAARWTQLRRLSTPAATGRCQGRSPLPVSALHAPRPLNLATPVTDYGGDAAPVPALSRTDNLSTLSAFGIFANGCA